MINADLLWLLEWYHSQCDGDWEHGNGIQIGTIDNPGWYIKICLEETPLQCRSFNEVKIDRTEDDWMRCFIKNGIFEGIGGSFNLPEILRVFRDWAEPKNEIKK